MDNYSYRVFWSESDGAYVAVCPDSPRFSGIRETPENALSELHEVMEEAVDIYDQEGWPLPTPARESGSSEQPEQPLSRRTHGRNRVI